MTAEATPHTGFHLAPASRTFDTFVVHALPQDKEDIVETKPPATSSNSGKPLKKARKVAGKKVPSSGGGGGGGGGAGNGGTGSGNNNSNSNNTGHFMDQHHQALSPAQLAVNEQMRKALEEDQYSANGSIVDTDSDDDEHQFP